MTFNTWLKCLRSDHWNQRYTLCIMILIGCISISANNSCWYQTLEVMTYKQWKKEAPPEFSWTNVEQSLAKASYFIGFFASSIPGCLLADSFGGKAVFGFGCTCSGLGTIITPPVVKYAGVVGVIVLRIIVGAGEGMMIPAGLNLLTKWVPLQGRGLLVGLFLTAPQLGLIFGNLGSGYMISVLNWPISLYIWGAICLLYCALFFLLCYSAPLHHPFISDRELKFLLENVPLVRERKRSVVFKQIVNSVRGWCAIISSFGFYWCFYSSFIMDFPKYANRVLGIVLEERGAMMSIPFSITYAVSLPGCYIADFVLQKKFVKRWVLRRVCAFLSSIPPAALIVGAYHCGSRSPAATLCLFALTLVFMSFYFCGLQINTLKLSPRNLTLVIAVVNTFGAMAAIIAPIVHASVTSSNQEHDWHIVGWICFLVLASGTFLYCLCGSAERKRWDEQENDDEYKGNVRIRLRDSKRVSEQVAEQVAKLISEGSLSHVQTKDEDDEKPSPKGILKKDGNKHSRRDSDELTTEILSIVSAASKDEDDRTSLKGILKNDGKEYSGRYSEESKTKGFNEVLSALKNKEDNKIGGTDKVYDEEYMTRLADLRRASEEVEEQVAKLIGEDLVALITENDEEEGTSRKGILKKDWRDSGESRSKGLSIVSEGSKDEEDNYHEGNDEYNGEEEEEVEGVTIVEPYDDEEEEEEGVTVVESYYEKEGVTIVEPYDDEEERVIISEPYDDEEGRLTIVDPQEEEEWRVTILESHVEEEEERRSPVKMLQVKKYT